MYIITGQTATGKTNLAYELAKKHKGEIINFDSRQIYQKLNIITGKQVFPDVKTHLIDIVDPKEQFSSFDFANSAKRIINYLIRHNIMPILVGGTYLYLKHLLYGIDTKVPADWKLREELGKKSVKQLQDILKKHSVQTFERLNQSDRNNPHRLIRKIEIYSTHLTFPERKKTNYFPGKYNYKLIGLRFKSNESLKKAIEKRVEQRVRNGAFQEVKHLIKQGYKSTDPGMQTIGYKQLIQYYSGTISRDEALQQWITKEVQYAKRQYTFMKKDKNIKWKSI
ncbi:tRNA (adenosine(37)-N6)-dimethylallyltransferase MiaA [Candidatus Roizmanbacteria bacterium RIFCSPHIGHO2_12_FULL_33_9]|uniref:tRNA dimethylallyltransferase n=1 Tax=Candidatus Roizmanbacteria bacterium RIFCSPHIGHO2_12_FULL_33_9 TaxID=1802045 RepID=A0A1F7HIN0_9BACT|nr:MAG: tRNA (adenosine(37)-N6)-dimethylallyltransferase MiaA [Candidatus Roizmanbacteria bacterium RIFCSPHIGHO2_12_FULL_33_9]